MSEQKQTLEETWPHGCGEYTVFCQQRGLDMDHTNSEADFADLWDSGFDDGICSICGWATKPIWDKQIDPFATGDSPTEYHYAGTRCCGSRAVILNADGSEVETYEMDLEI